MDDDEDPAFALTNTWLEDVDFRRALDQELGGRWITCYTRNHWTVEEDVRGGRILDSYRMRLQPAAHGDNPDLNCSLYSLYLHFSAVDGNLERLEEVVTREAHIRNINRLHRFCNRVIRDPRFRRAFRVWGNYTLAQNLAIWRRDVRNWWDYQREVMHTRRLVLSRQR